MVKPQCRHLEAKLSSEWTLSLVFLNDRSQVLKRTISNCLMYLIACNSSYLYCPVFPKRRCQKK